MDAYRRQLLAERNGTPPRAREEKAKPRAAAPKGEGAPLRAELARCEARVAKLEAMRAEIDGRLANPLLYARGDSEQVARLQKKRAEVEEGLARAEALWEAALERLETAGAGG
jgi:ATP-binding cassette subfamily F protein 3